MQRIFILFYCILLNSCAVLHHAQLGDIDATGKKSKRIDLKVSETGVNLQEAGRIVRQLGNQSFRKQTDDLTAIIGLFQMGPKTGNTVYSSDYARSLFDMIYAECQSGKISNLTVIRETRKYPVVSGEIVKINANCWL